MLKDKQILYAAQIANTIFAGPTIGSPSPPSYRSLVSADINSFSHVQNGNTYGTNSIIGTIDNFNINFITNNITRVIISNIGNVGIGTNTLTEKFNINGYSLATGYKTPSGLSTGFLKADGSIDSTSYLSLAPTLQQVLTNGNVADKELIIQRSVNNAEAITVADFNGAAKIKLYADTNGGYTAFTNDSQSTSIILNGYTGSGTYGVNGEILIDPNSSLIVLDSTLSNSIFKVDRVNDVVNINGTFYSTSLDNGSFLGVRDGDSYLGWQNKGNPQTVGEIHFNSTKGEYFYEKTDNSSGLLAGGRVNIDLTLMFIKHLTKISLSSPLMEVSQNPTTALGIASKQYVDASASSLTLQQVTTNGNTTTNQIIVPSVKSPIDASKILFYVGGPTITSSDSYNQSVTDNSGSRIIYDNGSIFGQVKANLNQIEVYHDTQIIATSPIFTWNGNTIETQNNKATTFSVVNNTLYPTVQAAYNADEAILASANNYTDNLVNGLSWKKSVLYSTTTSENLSLTGLTATIDGTSRTLLTTDRILVKNQTTASQNGIYNPSTTSWTRVTDANTNTTILSATVYVRDGSAEKNRVYAVNVSPITIGTTSITFALISGTGTYTYGSYLKLTGNVFDIDFTTFTSNNVIEGGSNLYFTNSRGISATLTGYISGVGVISSTDSILQAIQKLNGNINALPTPVTSVTGTLNRITSTVGTTPIIDISSNYIGQSTITTLGIITTGTWNGTQIADVYLASASNWNSKQTGSTNLTSLSALTFVSTSFVKMSATGTFVLDTNTYLTSNQTITLSGDVTGTGTTSITTSILSTTVTNKVLTGYVSGAGTISATDSILQAIQKLNGNISSLVTGVSSVNTLTGVVVLTTANISDSLNKRYVTDANLVVIGNTSNTNSGDNAINSLYSGLATSKENAITGTTSVDFWSGAKTFINFATTVRSTVLTGLSNATSQVIASTDSVLLALGYLQGQINVNITSIATKQSTLVSGTNIRTVNGSTLLGNTDLQVGTILGSLPATAGLIPFASGTANTITTDPNFKFTSASGLLSYGGAFTGQSLPANRLNIDQTGTSGTSINVYNTTTTAFSSLLFEQTGTQFGGFFRYNSGYVGNYTGTSLAFADSFQIQSGNANNKPFIISVTPFVIQCGVSSTNLASRNDAVGYRIDTLSSIHTTNLNPFTVNGKSYLGGNSTATAVVHIAAGTATAGTAPIKLTAGTNLTVIENGTIEYDGTNYFMSASNIRNKIGTELTISSGLTRATNTITNNLITGLSGGQTIIGGTGSGENLTLSSTSNATKGKIITNDILLITDGTNTSTSTIGANSSIIQTGSTSSTIKIVSGTKSLSMDNYSVDRNYLDSTGAALIIRTIDNQAVIFFTNNTQRFAILSNSGFNVSDANDFNFGTTTGTKLGFTNLNKLAFWGATPIVQPVNTTSINDVLTNTGLMTSGIQTISFNPTTSSSGATSNFLFTKPNNTNQTASISINGWQCNGGTRQWATGNITTQIENSWGATTYSFVGASTITTAYGNYFSKPIVGTNAIITNNYSLGTDGSISIFNPIADTTSIAYIGSQSTGNVIIGNLNNGVSSNYQGMWINQTPSTINPYNYVFQSDGFSRMFFNSPGYLAFSSSNVTLFQINQAQAGTATSGFVYSAGSNTNQTLSTEIPGYLFNSYSRQWATGAIPTQREYYIKSVTYTAVGASTISNAYGLYVEAPTASTNITITNNYAAGFKGNIIVGDFTTGVPNAPSTGGKILVAGNIYNSAIGGTPVMSGGMVIKSYQYNSNPTVSKLSFILGTDSLTPTEQMFVLSTGVFGINGGAYFTAPSTNDIYNIVTTTSGAATQSVAIPSNKIMLKGNAWNNAQGSFPNVAYLQVNNVVNNVPITVDKLSFFVGSANNSNATTQTAATAVEQMAINTLGVLNVLSNIFIGDLTTAPIHKIQTNGNIYCDTTGKGLIIKSGTNQRAGNATLVAGTVTVSNTTVTANTIVMLTHKTSGGTIGVVDYTLTAGTSFTITSNNALDTSTYSYFLIETA